MTVTMLATSGIERRDLLIATAKLQLFQGQESISGIAAAAIKNVVWHCLSMVYIANATQAIPLPPPLYRVLIENTIA